VAGGITALLALLALGAGAVLADGGPGGDVANPLILNAQIARPAVVRIVKQYDLELDVHLCTGKVGQYTESVISTGSGAFISPHGDILTAGHVVTDPIGDVQSVASSISSDLQSLCHQTVSADEVVGTFVQNPELFTLKYSNQTNSVYLSTAYVGMYTEANIAAVTAYPFTVIGISPETQNDVAVIHVNLDDMPSLPLGDSTKLSPTDTLVEIGFPGNGDLHGLDDLQGEKPNNFFTDSVNFLTVSALKTNDSGGKLLQVSGNVEHGDSGGPLVNQQGQVVGVVSFGVSETGGTSFAQAVSSATGYTSGLDLKPGKFQTAWRQAMTTYAATANGHWHQAATSLQSLKQSYPKFGAVAPYLAYALSQAQQESLPKATPTSTMPIDQLNHWLDEPANNATAATSLGALTALFLTIGGIGALRRRSQAQKAAKAEAKSQEKAHAEEPVGAHTPSHGG
jgi:S1-C subfamily serine protease